MFLEKVLPTKIYLNILVCQSQILQVNQKIIKKFKMTIKIGINGMGRIGRMVIRSIIESQNKKI